MHWHSSSRVHPRFFGGGGAGPAQADPAHRTGEFCRREQHTRPARPAEPCRAGQRAAKGRHHPAAEPRCPEAHRAAGPADQRTLAAAAERIHASQASEEVERHLALHPRPQLLARELAPEAGLPARLQPFLDVLDHVRRRRCTPNRASIACGIGSQFLIVPVASASAIAALRANVDVLDHVRRRRCTPNRASIACGIGSQFLIVPVASASAIAALRANVEAHGRFEADGLHVRPAVDLLARFVALQGLAHSEATLPSAAPAQPIPAPRATRRGTGRRSRPLLRCQDLRR